MSSGICFQREQRRGCYFDDIAYIRERSQDNANVSNFDQAGVFQPRLLVSISMIVESCILPSCLLGVALRLL